MLPLYSPMVERALRLAARAHRHHHRKASDLPYLTHPAAVALILMQAGFHDEAVLAAALMHDVVEDTSYSLDDLAAEFPLIVVEYVAALSEKKYDRTGKRRSWQSRKQEHLDLIANAPIEVRAIALADKLHNLSAMLYDLEAGDELWSRFGAAPEKILWYHHAMVDQAAQSDERLQPLAMACRGLLIRLEAQVISAEDREA